MTSESKSPVWWRCAALTTAMMLSVVGLSGCNDEPATTETEESAETASEPVASESADEPALVQEGDSVEADLDGATTPGTPVNYNVAAWSQQSVEPIEMSNDDAIRSAFGEVVSTDDNSLDYASNPATKYRYMAEDKPYLDIIDSNNYLELGWYFANPPDSDSEKDASKTHAEKGYQLARQLMGDDGGKLISDILRGQIVKNTMVGTQQVELAKCEFYSCMVILKKADNASS